MNVWKWFAGIAIFALLAGCNVQPETVTPGNSNDSKLLVSGEIVRVETAYSYQGAANFTSEAHAVVTLCYMVGFDAPCETLATQRIEGVKAFPVPFLLEGKPDEVFSRGGYYLVFATVYMGASDQLYVGDFSDNIWNQIEKPTTDIKIRVSGLERCGAPGGGGGCAEGERP